MTDRDRLIKLFNKIEYTPFPEMTMKSNLKNQFTDYALNCIVDEILANGVIVPPCKVGDYVRFKGLTSLWQVDAIHYYREGLPQITVTNGKVTSTITDFETFEVVTKEECD